MNCNEAATVSAYEVQTSLKCDRFTGLSDAEASARRRKHGANELPKDPPDPMWKKYLQQFNNPFIILLLISAAVSVGMRQIDDAVSIGVAIVIVISVGFVQEYRSERTLERLSSLLPPSCRCLRNGTSQILLAKELVPGDIVVLAVGDRIPADVRLLESAELAVDESSFTGETEPANKSSSTVDRRLKMDYGDMTNIGFLGTMVCAGNATAVVIATGKDSQFGEVFKLMQSEEPPRTPLQKNMDRLGKQLTIYSLGVIVVIFLVGYFQGKPPLEMFNVGVSLAVAAIPEGLPIVVTVTLALGVMRMARRNAVIKRLPTVEALGCVDVVCSDKTGTLTSNRMTVSCVRTTDVILGGGAGGGGGGGGGAAQTEDDELSPAAESKRHEAATKELVEAAVVCNNAFVAAAAAAIAVDIGDDSRQSSSSGAIRGTPTEVALLQYAIERGLADGARRDFVRTAEVPFSSDTKTMAVTCTSADVKYQSSVVETHFLKGAVESVLARCGSSAGGGGGREPLGPERRRRIEEAAAELNATGLRTMGFAKGRDPAQLVFLGLIGLKDPLRPTVKDSVARLRSSGVAVLMITGDAKETAASVASELGLARNGGASLMLSGNDLDLMTDDDLADAADDVAVYFRASPRHKLRIVKALQRCGHVVGMTGDGVNDGVAIRRADVGVAMGSGTDVCKEAADMILVDDNFSTILGAVEEGKCIFYNIRNFVRFQLSTSISALMLISLSTVFNIPNPLNPMQILWINVIMDGPPAQSLGVEPVDHEVLKKPPRKVGEQILTRSLLNNILLSAAVIISGTLWVFKMTMEDGKITPRDTTMTFTCFVFFDMFNALTCRSQRLIHQIGFFSNKFFCVAVGFSVLGQLAVIYFPPLQYVFQTEPLDLKDIVLLVCLSSSVFFISEAKKLIENNLLPWSLLVKSVFKTNDAKKRYHAV